MIYKVFDEPHGRISPFLSGGAPIALGEAVITWHETRHVPIVEDEGRAQRGAEDEDPQDSHGSKNASQARTTSPRTQRTNEAKMI